MKKTHAITRKRNKNLKKNISSKKVKVNKRQITPGESVREFYKKYRPLMTKLAYD